MDIWTPGQGLLGPNACILHSDINSAYASMSLAYKPHLRDKPVAIGGDEEQRHGIILAKNQIAKRFGVQTGSALWEAKRACKNLIILPPEYRLYKLLSSIVFAIYYEYTSRVQPFGLDEAWLDVTGEDGFRIANELRTRIFKETGMTISVGVSFNKVLAKLGSDMKKPNAVTVLSREDWKEKAFPLPASDLLNVGPETTAKLRNYYITTIGQLAECSEEWLCSIFGKNGTMLYVFANGYDRTPVNEFGECDVPMKTIGNSQTYYRDIVDKADYRMMVLPLCESVAARLRENGVMCETLSISLRDFELHRFSRQMKLRHPTNLCRDIWDAACGLVEKCFPGTDRFPYPFRSLGVRGMGLVPNNVPVQLDLEYDAERQAKKLRLERSIDGLRERFGYASVQRLTAHMDRAGAMLDAKGDNTVHPVSYMRAAEW